MKKTFFFVIVLSLLAVFLWQVGLNLQKQKNTEEVVLGVNPLNSSYLIEGEVVSLVDGKFEKEFSLDSASKITVSMFGEPVFGDVDMDGDDDALVMLVQNSGGSGSFYYSAIAIKEEDGFKGTNSILLGDRISPQTMEIRNGIAIANYAERKETDSFTEAPSIAVSKYMFLKDENLEQVNKLETGETVLWGNIVWGGEVRTFVPCGDGNPEYWIMGNSSALDEVKTSYESATKDVLPANYAPLFSVVVGQIVSSPQDGFGADYKNAIEISQVIKTSRVESCKSDLIVLESPLVGSDIESPLTIKGMARGTWFFEASFPIILTDWDGKIISQSYATAKSDWMTEEFVPFEAVLEFDKPEGTETFNKRGSLILKKDNPSGLPEHDDALEITVYFK